MIDDPRSKTLVGAFLFCAFLSVFGGAIVFCFRWRLGVTDFSIDVYDVLRSIGFAVAIMATATCAHLSRWPAWSIALAQIVAGAAVLYSGAKIAFLGDLELIIWLGFLLFFGVQLNFLKLVQEITGLIWIVVMAGLLAISHSVALIRFDVASPLAFERALVYLQNKDSLFHSAIAGIIGRFNTVSIGIDGLIPIEYHSLSHYLFQNLADWSGLPSLLAYSLFLPSFWLPIMIFSLVSISSVNRRLDYLKFNSTFALLMAVLAMIAFSVFAYIPMWLSESAIVSMCFFLLALMLMARGVSDCGDWSRAATFVVLIPLIILTSLSKISVGAVLTVGVGVWVLLLYELRWQGFILGGLVAVLPFLFVFLDGYGEAASKADSLLRFGFLTSIHKSPSLVIAVVIFGYLLYRMSRKMQTSQNSETIFLRSIIAIFAAGVFASSVLDLPSQAQLYFVAPALWACLAAIIWDGQIGALFPDRPANQRFGLVVLLAALALVATGWIKLAVLSLNLGEQKMLAFAQPVTTASLLQNTQLGQIFLQVKADTNIKAIYLAPDLVGFWDGPYPCWVASLQTQALTALPLILGLPPQEKECDLPTTYGFADYDTSNSSSTALTEIELCQKAARNQVSTILKVTVGSFSTLKC